jgi:hypothetical protein
MVVARCANGNDVRCPGFAAGGHVPVANLHLVEIGSVAGLVCTDCLITVMDPVTAAEAVVKATFGTPGDGGGS